MPYRASCLETTLDLERKHVTWISQAIMTVLETA
jgi:hypothetical protein